MLRHTKRFSTRDANYFKYVQPYQFHTSQDLHSTINMDERGFYYIYSFAINPEEYNPSGSWSDEQVLTGQSGLMEESAKIVSIHFQTDKHECQIR